ncbi:MAG: 30S ribosomal protein S2 [Candidatus Colwellbacteria bacterium RBG_13_48_8]|uniref:Small ribosomal subunit protein uS2 n=1 Tax=Candidatus Colwellbacteria bacterium RBG_13_48_8 TaxID=1797685 RepID=A0A1G1YXQ2_9BACT|nr:MAG: 30S ribosomal protein S2 [Candidatus Colwellbacteria bacterium RBG_13_48_8]
MMELGVFYGRSKSKTNPKMRPYILTNRSGFAVIDLEKTLAAIKKIKGVIEDIAGQRGLILFVGTSPSVKNAVKTVAEELGFPYVSERWLGGTLTNFDTITKRIQHFKRLRSAQQEGTWEKYTKKERVRLERELHKLERLFSGIESLDKLPALVFIADLANNEIAAREARGKGVKIIGILNTDSNPTLVDYRIPGNERSIHSIGFLLNYFKEVIIKAREQQPASVDKVDRVPEKKE